MTGIEIALFILAVLIMLAGLAGTILPAVPGVPLVFATALLFAWLTNFDYVDGRTIGIFAIITGVSLVLDWAATTFGVKKMGGSWAGVVGAFIGMIVGLLIPGAGIVGFIVGAFVGAVGGELLIGKPTHTALRAGTGSFIGFILGGVLKFALACVMIGWFVWEVLG